MKKILFLLLVCALNVFAVNAQSEKFYVYGVDFSQARVYGAGESVEDFATAFNNINMLLITEPQKYDFSKMLNTRVGVDIESMINKLATCNYDNLKVLTPVYEDIDCASIIRDYTLRQTEGTGVVLIANFLNKVTAEAVYDLVIFDVNTREIHCQRQVVGKARGFGLRNFWAGSIYGIIQEMRINVAQ